MDAQIGLIMDFSSCPILTIRIQKGSLLPIFMAWPLELFKPPCHNSCEKDYKDPLAYQGKLFTLHCYVINT